MTGRTGALWAALAFFTRVPVPRGVTLDERSVRRASAYAPLAGWLVGALAGAVYALGALALPPFVAATLAVAASAWITGGLHEDGLADLCDGLGATRDPARALEIMRDPRSGAFGVLGLVLATVGRIGALAAIGAAAGPAAVAVVLVAAHALSRAACVSLLATERYARPRAEARAPAMLEPLAPARLAGAAGAGALPLLALAPLGLGAAALAALPALVAREALARLVRARLGGFTGDCLGAVQQASELTFYLGAAAVLA